MCMALEKECFAQAEGLLLGQEGAKVEPGSPTSLSKGSFWSSSLRGWFYFHPKKTPRKFHKIISGVELFFLQTDSLHPRLGIVIPRKYGNAVKRNSIKRKIRFWFWKKTEQIKSKTAILRITSDPGKNLDKVLKSVLECWENE